MKYTELIISIVIFAGILFAMLSSAATMGKDYSSKDFEKYDELANTYDKNYIDIGVQENGTLKKISNSLDKAEFSRVSAAVGAIDAVLQAAKLMINSIATVGKVANQASQDAEGLIPPIVIRIIKSIVAITLIMIVMVVFLKMKPET